MRVLITNIEMRWRSGTTLYVRDLACELMRQGHEPVVFTLTTGTIAEELQRAGVSVETSLHRIQMRPDIIHGHHRPVTCAALRHYAEVPAIYICHDHKVPFDSPPLHPHILAYFAVSRFCFERVKACGIPEENIRILHNFVDVRRFPMRAPLPHRPHRALIFSNYANDSTHLPPIKEACRAAGLEVDIVGQGVGRIVHRPEEILGDYDLVFAKGKAAMEAMAVGSAVVLCDFAGLGPMVSSREFSALQQMNFGFQALRNPLEPELLVQQIERYDAVDAARVRDLLRNGHRLDRTVEKLLGIYQQVVNMKIPAIRMQGGRPLRRERFGEAVTLKLLQADISLADKAWRETLKRAPGYKLAQEAYWKLLQGQ